MNETARTVPVARRLPQPIGRAKRDALPRRRRHRFWQLRHLSDREFLAPALEILETPASPVHMAFIWVICLLVVIGLGLAYFGRIDIIATAQGKFQPTG